MFFFYYAHPCFCLILRVYPRRAFKRKAMEFLWVAGIIFTNLGRNGFGFPQRTVYHSWRQCNVYEHDVGSWSQIDVNIQLCYASWSIRSFFLFCNISRDSPISRFVQSWSPHFPSARQKKRTANNFFVEKNPLYQHPFTHGITSRVITSLTPDLCPSWRRRGRMWVNFPTAILDHIWLRRLLMCFSPLGRLRLCRHTRNSWILSWVALRDSFPHRSVLVSRSAVSEVWFQSFCLIRHGGKSKKKKSYCGYR